MNENVILRSKIYLWVLISPFAISLIFYLSVLFLPILLLIMVVSLLVLLLFELATKKSKKNWPSFLCWSWLAVAVPTFGIMPLLLAWELIYFLPLRRPLVTFTGLWLTAVYNLFIPTPESYQDDHSFPPLTALQFNLLGGGTLLVSLLPLWILRMRGQWKFGPRHNAQ